MTEPRRSLLRPTAWAVLATSLSLALAEPEWRFAAGRIVWVDELTALALVAIATLAAAFLTLTRS